ncbi:MULTISPECIES: N-acetylmannosamine-6-phosphate 2-epimerase [unclassified Streptomyces]|uniref:N-acetylmannosamine-6-phosphate 2-epimerase n=1 Tax=unclassified Streptomyces TaxID=2593676 RepID=UPI0035D8B2E1
MSHPSPATSQAGTVPLLSSLAGGLVVSCQARPGEPLHGPRHMAAMALSAELGGARAVRVNGPEDVRAVKDVVGVPVIGLWKDGDDGVYITPTLTHALRVAEAGADVVALDATERPRGDGRTLAETTAAVHDAGALVMADVSTLAEGLAAAAAGADMLSTTLSGYTPYSPSGPGPDLHLVRELAAAGVAPVFAEGRYATPAAAADALRLGAHAVVVGGAITRPTDITARFADALAEEQATPAVPRTP